MASWKQSDHSIFWHVAQLEIKLQFGFLRLKLLLHALNTAESSLSSKAHPLKCGCVRHEWQDVCVREEDDDANNADEHVTAFIRVVYGQFKVIRALLPFSHIHSYAVHAHTHTAMGELFVAARLSTTLFFPHCSPFASHSLISHINTNASKLVSLEAAEFRGVFTVSTVGHSGSLFRTRVWDASCFHSNQDWGFLLNCAKCTNFGYIFFFLWCMII